MNDRYTALEILRMALVGIETNGEVIWITSRNGDRESIESAIRVLEAAGNMDKELCSERIGSWHKWYAICDDPGANDDWADNYTNDSIVEKQIRALLSALPEKEGE